MTTPANPSGADDTSVAGRTITITGGTGSFGSTWPATCSPTASARINIFSRDEAKQDEMRRALRRRARALLPR